MTTQEVPPANKPDLSFVAPFAQATKEVLQTMSQVKQVKKTDAFVGAPPENATRDLVGIIGISGNTAGNVILSMSSSLAKTMVANMLGLDKDGMTEDDLSDGIGEILNMIAGSAKTKMSATGQTAFHLALPSVILGKDIQLAGNKKASSLTIQFDADGEELFLQIELLKKAGEE